MTPYKIISPTASEVPIIVSVPHCGVLFPDEIKAQYHSSLIESPDDTDWFVHQLYDFVSSMGMTMIHAVYSRWVIDLNRDPKSKPLYNDGRIITALCPTTNFIGNPLYTDERKEVDSAEVERRLKVYYNPYHEKIQELLQVKQKKFGKALLWDCHSIREYVLTIQKEKFPDLILGDVDGTSADSKLIDRTLEALNGSRYTVNHNHPFKGGYITRHFGKPAQNIHALQLEMTKVNYMDDAEKKYDEQRASQMRTLLMKTFQSLIDQLKL
ncbi:N-formylglutamate amidohydrolase [Pseudochryseolinea flava]|uniref:N-formylglutamate deformylase n=1 Tax=Pseudochryseolinea flava TaxID=2059302 RepID=A0A364YA00_9BACT|nr:N-formylglutamate amidohydrolase [Pseudochryseolinea flava]RAW03179.1 N-formylglutamate deformylase [Pseudochryseolinea flava]